MTIRNIAIIDFGSHAVKCFVYAVEAAQANKIFALKAKTRLGQDLEKNGLIREQSIAETEQLLRDFISQTAQFGISEIIAVGTSALRVCQNQMLVCARFAKVLNTAIRILSDHEESVLIAKGFIFKNPQIKNAFLLDLGGGSTELAVIKNGHNDFSLSLPFGAIRVQDKFLKTHPPTETNVNSVEQQIINHIKANFQSDAENLKAFGLSGGIKTIFKLQWDKSPDDFCLKAAVIHQYTEELKKLSLTEIKAIPGMPAERADIALAGLIIVNEIIKYFKIPELYWDSSALKDGLLAANLNIA